MLIRSRQASAGFSMIEILVTLVIIAFGLLGLAGLQLKFQTSEMESYQRAQALVLLTDMSERISANNGNASSYVTSGTIGTGDSQPGSCTGLAPGSVARDICEWSNELKGSAETLNSAKTGAMIGALGCITQVTAPDPTSGVCQPGVYRVAVAWQGLVTTASPAVTCGQNQFGTDSYRRVVSSTVTVGLPGCS